MKKKVVLSALHYPLTMARYMWEAFEDRDDVELWVTGPFFGNWIPWNGSMNLDLRYVKTPDFPLPSNASVVFGNFINQVCPFDSVDLWLSVDAGWCIESRPSKAKVFAQIQTDPHVLKDRYRKYRPQYDLSFSMQSPYMDEGEIYLPYGYSKRYHYFEDMGHPDHDICLIGLDYQHRHHLVERLRQSAFIVRSGIGIVYDEYRQAYCKSGVALSWSSLQDTPARFYEALAMRVPLVSNRTPDIFKNGFVDGEDFLGFDTEDEAIEKIRYILDDNHKLEKFMMVNNGYEKVKPFSWDNTVEIIMKESGLL